MQIDINEWKHCVWVWTEGAAVWGYALREIEIWYQVLELKTSIKEEDRFKRQEEVDKDQH